MVTLALDTSYKYLSVGIYEDGKLLAGCSYPCFKRQNEQIFVEMDRLLKECHLELKNVDEVIITDGPGSYTGLRIAMTIAKVFATQKKDAVLKTISSLELYAGKEPAANVILDARGHRVYAAHIENGKTQWMGILDVDEIQDFFDRNPGVLLGDLSLVGQEDKEPDFLENFAALRQEAPVVENVHALIPRYLKESDAYKV